MRPLTYRTKLLLWCALAVAVVAGVGFAVWPREPQYDGRPLSYWLDQLPPTMPVRGGYVTVLHYTVFGEGTVDFTNTAAFTALDTLGTGSLPTLVRRLRVTDSGLRNLAVSVNLLPARRWDSEMERDQAVTAFVHLGNTARPVLPDVIALAKLSRYPVVRQSALQVLRQLSPTDYAQLLGQSNVVSGSGR